MQDTDLDVRLRGKTFVCGVGVQKAGTTWLHDYLARRREIFMSVRKELHYFDSKFASAKTARVETAVVNGLKRHLGDAVDGAPLHYSEKLTELVDMLRMQYDEHGYAGYFARRVGEQALFGEVTPAYCLIGEAGFRYMKQLFPRTKIIYLMRDPIDRHYSLMRMQERNQGTPGLAQRNFLSTLDNKFSRNMADYASHVEALRSVFSESELYIGYYETLFTDAEIARICDFLGIAFEPAAYATRLNTSDTAQELDPELVRAARAKFAATYDYCRRTFPGLPASWRV